jgi:hypothetical protein
MRHETTMTKGLAYMRQLVSTHICDRQLIFPHPWLRDYTYMQLEPEEY